MTARLEKQLVGDYRRLTAREKKHPKSILKYPRDWVFKPCYNVRYIYVNKRETRNS